MLKENFAEKPLFTRKKMAPKKDSAHHYGYGWYNEKQLEDYYNKIIGNFFNNVSIAKLTIYLCLLHISLRWPRQDPREEDLHRCQEDHLPGGCQVRRHPCLDWWDPHDDLQLRNLHSPNPQSTRPSRRTATLIRPAPWSTTTSSSPSYSASTPRAKWGARSCLPTPRRGLPRCGSTRISSTWTSTRATTVMAAGQPPWLYLKHKAKNSIFVFPL